MIRVFLIGLGLLLAGVACLAQVPMTGAGLPTPGGAPSFATNSLALVSASSQNLTQTGKITINQQKFTPAAWFKNSTAANQAIFNFSDGTTNNRAEFGLSTTGQIVFVAATAASNVAALTTTATFDDGNWHQVTLGIDTTQATSTNRLLMYVDCVAISAFAVATYPAQNTNLSNNFADAYQIGSRANASRFFNGKLAQVYYIDGQQKDYTAFNDGSCKPKAYSGTYAGTFDFFLPFSNAGALGTDTSGEGNNWTLNNSPTQSSDHP
jgi:hypothetical protein